MDEMRELIDEAAVERAFAVLAVAGPLVGLAGGAVWSSLNKAAPRIGLLRGLAIGLLGPLLLGLWRLFSWLVRYEPAPDPANDYFGLERVDVLLLNVVIFVAVGASIGWLVRKVRANDAATAAGEPAPEAGSLVG